MRVTVRTIPRETAERPPTPPAESCAVGHLRCDGGLSRRCAVIGTGRTPGRLLRRRPSFLNAGLRRRSRRR
jgi:hypothetical protein